MPKPCAARPRWRRTVRAGIAKKASLDGDGRDIRLSPGMNVTAEIKTGRRRVIDFLLSPIQRTANESVRER